MFSFDPNLLRQAVGKAAGRADVQQAMIGLYRDLAERIEQRKPVCVMSGRCCRFEEFGHRLFVTTLELAAFVGELRQAGREKEARGLLGAWDRTGCPFQREKLCGVHAFRPFGCRIFFCDSTARQWQEQTYEAFHKRLKELHEAMGVEYYYVEWRAALEAMLGTAAVGVVPGSMAPGS